MADYKVKASTDDIRIKAAEIETCRTAMEGLMTEMQSKVTSYQDVFKSAAGTEYVAKYTGIAKTIQASLDELSKVINNMKRAADEFDRLDTGNTTTVNNMTGELSNFNSL